MKNARILIAVLATLVALSPSRAFAIVTSQFPQECLGIDLRATEGIESQGFLGMLTPKADWRVTKGALEDAQLLENWREVALKSGMGWDEFQKNAPWRIRGNKTWEQIVASDFRLAQLCTLAKQRGLKRLTFACVGDTHSGESTTTHFGTFGSETKSGDWVDTECFVSTYAGGDDPSISDLRSAQWGKSAKASEYTSPMSRYDALSDPNYRRSLYMDLIREAVSGTAPYRLAPAQPKPESCATPSGAPLDAGALPVSSSHPAATSSSHSP